MQNKINNRLLKYDLMRAISITCIVLIHVAAYIVIYFNDSHSSEFIVGNIFNGATRFAVTLFIMISGALLLNEDKPFDAKTFYKKSVLKLVTLLVFWLVVYALWYSIVLPLISEEAIDLSNIVNYIFTYSIGDYNHLWYLFMCVGIYIMIPVLRLFVKRENVKYIIGIIAVCFAVQFIPRTFDFLTYNFIASYSEYVSRLYLKPANGVLGILLLAWYLNNFELKKSHRIVLYALGIVSIVGSALAVQLLFDTVSSTRLYFYDILALPVVLGAAAVFEFVSYEVKDTKSENKYLIAYSDMSFGIYIVHIAILEVFTKVLFPFTGGSALATLAYILLMTIVVILVSSFICYLVDKNKALRKLLYMR